MNSNNELISVIESARSNGNFVKQIRKQKYAPNQFYMTLSSGKQLGPVNVAGNEEELTRKYDEANQFIAGFKNGQPRKAA